MKQLADLPVLTENEMDLVSGAFFFNPFAFAGNAVIDVVKVTNDIFNTKVAASVGKAFDRVGLGVLHYVPDRVAYSIFRGAAALGGALGGNPNRVTYHYEEEWIKGTV